MLIANFLALLNVHITQILETVDPEVNESLCNTEEGQSECRESLGTPKNAPAEFSVLAQNRLQKYYKK